MKFKVKNRDYIVGRGFVTVIDNPSLIPIDKTCKVKQGSALLPIRLVETEQTLMEHPRILPSWGIFTSEETIGDYLDIELSSQVSAKVV